MAETLDDNFKAEMLDFKSEMLDFKVQVLRFVEVANQKFDGLTSDLRSTSIRLDKLEQRIEALDSKFDSLATIVKEIRSDLKILTSQFNKVGSLSIQDHERVNNLELRVADLESATH